MKSNIFVAALLGALMFSASSHATLVASYDVANKCNIYRVKAEDMPFIGPEVVVVNRNVYGLSLENMDVDFDNRRVTVDAIVSIPFWFDRSVVSGRVWISPENPQFKFLLNQLNRKIVQFERMCITTKNELIYARHLNEQAENNSSEQGAITK